MRGGRPNVRRHKIWRVDNIKSIIQVPKGTIIAFDEAKTAIPQGWRLCDGRYGTPDLRGEVLAQVKE